MQQCQIYSKIKWKVQTCPVYPLISNAHTASPSIISSQQSDTFVTIESALTHCYQPKSIVCPGVHSWCWTFYGFCTNNDIHPQLQYHTEYIHCHKNPLCSTYSSLSPLKPQAVARLFTVAIVSPFQEYLNCWKWTVCTLLRLVFFFCSHLLLILKSELSFSYF